MKYEEAMQHCIFRYVSGSHAYGTNRPDSDTDYRGVFVAPLRSMFELFKTKEMGSGDVREALLKAVSDIEQGFFVAAKDGILHSLETSQGDLQLDKKTETIRKPGEDEEIHELRKFLRLAADCNPNIIEYLYVDRLVTHETDMWKSIRGKRDLFLSKKARWTFSGYAIAQMKRIETHRGYLFNPPAKKPDRKDYGLPLNSSIPAEHRRAILSIPESYLGNSVRSEVVAEEKYRRALEEWNSYQKWQAERNPARKEMEAKYGYDVKHAAHLVRLIRMAREILTEGVVHVYRPDRDQLRDILGGQWTYEQLMGEVSEIDSQLKELYDKSPLRDAADRAGIAALYAELCEKHYGISLG